MLQVAAKLGLRFNGGKCSFLSVTKGRASGTNPISIHGVFLHSLEAGETETYLGVPLG